MSVSLDSTASASPASGLQAASAHKPEHRHDPLEHIVVSAEAFRQSYALPESRPEAARGLQALAEAGFQLPLSYLSPGFRPLSTLAVVVRFSGHVGEKFTAAYHFRTVGFAGQLRVMENLKQFASRREKKVLNHSDGYHYNRLSRNGALIGRMLSQLGVLAGQHQNSGITVPPYLVNLATAYANGLTRFDGTARMLLHDTVAAMFFSCLAQYTAQGFRVLRLSAQTNEAAAINLATQVSHVIQSAFPGEKIDFFIRQRTSRSRNLPAKTPIYNPVVRFLPAAYERMASALGP